VERFGLDRLDRLHPASIPIGTEPRTVRRGEMVEQLGHGIVRAVCGDQLVARKRGPPVALDEWMRVRVKVRLFLF